MQSVLLAPEFCLGPARSLSLCPLVLHPGASSLLLVFLALDSVDLMHRSHQFGLDPTVFPLAHASGTKREEINLLNLLQYHMYFFHNICAIKKE